MNLIDFAQDPQFVALLKAMNAKPVSFEEAGWVGIDEEVLIAKLNSFEGIEIQDLSEITLAKDSTFEYKGKKVLLYIRDQYYYQDRTQEYKFHVTTCETISERIRTDRYDRYVVSTRTDGRFLVNIKDGRTRQFLQQNIIREMHVCKNCLLSLGYKGYRSHRDSLSIYREFMLEDFFRLYQVTPIITTPAHTEITAPLDQYPADFEQISQRIRVLKGWKCNKCKLDHSRYPKYLHVHHINGNKGDNSIGNLEVLCIKCHAEKPGHAHLKYNPDYRAFEQLLRGR